MLKSSVICPVSAPKFPLPWPVYVLVTFYPEGTLARGLELRGCFPPSCGAQVSLWHPILASVTLYHDSTVIRLLPCMFPRPDENAPRL